MRVRPGLAVAALGVIAVVTVAWWALALYPVASAPEWLTRTRLACFGAPPGALPNAGGWVLLVGEPIGMVGILVMVWGEELARDVRLLARRRWGALVLATSGAGLLWGTVAAAQVIHRANGSDRFRVVDDDFAPPVPLDAPAPLLRLIDQRATNFDLAALRGQPALVAFAYAHCETVCPTIVQQVRAARDASRPDVPLVIVTVDPWRDVVSRLPSMAAAWELAPHDRVLSGSVDAVERTLDAWNVGRARDSTTGEVGHATAVVLIDAEGRMRYRLDAGWWRLRTLLTGVR